MSLPSDVYLLMERGQEVSHMGTNKLLEGFLGGMTFEAMQACSLNICLQWKS